MTDVFTLSIFIIFPLHLLIGSGSLVWPALNRAHGLVGATSHVACAVVGLLCNAGLTITPTVKIIQAVCVSGWALKLGTYLFIRNLRKGGESRVDNIKSNHIKVLLLWMARGTWVYINMFPSLFLWDTSNTYPSVSLVTLIGWGIFLAGVTFETVADYQKYTFRRQGRNKDRFITSGLWSISRHPNYFGEIVLWYGLFLAAAPYFSSKWAFFTILCPTWTAIQLCAFTGIPLLEAQGVEKWGGEPAYAHYVYSTGVLVPWLVCCECTPLPNRDLLEEEEEEEEEWGDRPSTGMWGTEQGDHAEQTGLAV